MRMLFLLLLLLTWAAAEVHSQTVPYITFMEKTLPNHSYIDLSLVGNRVTGVNTVYCHTDLVTCCSRAQGQDRGDWYFPNQLRLQFSYNDFDIFESRTDRRAGLLRRGNIDMAVTGIYRCNIETTAVHSDNSSDITTQESVYVGLYYNGGDVTISDNITFTLISALDAANPEFTLTCVSTGGPATTVTWTRSCNDTIIKRSSTQLNNSETAEYIHSLTVTGRLGGLYTFAVSNNKPSEAIAGLNVQVALAPTNLTVFHEGTSDLRVSWSPPMPPGDTTGYRLYYSCGGIRNCVNLSVESTDYLLTDLQNRSACGVSIVAVSQHLPSHPVLTQNVLGLSVSITTILSTTAVVSVIHQGPNETAISYTISYSNTNTQCFTDQSIIANIAATNTSYSLTNLHGGTEYTVNVTILLSNGQSEIVTLTTCTLPKVPSEAPQSLDFSAVPLMAYSSVRVQWGLVDCMHHNGQLTGFFVQFEKQGSEITQTVQVTDLKYNTVLSDLLPSSTYSIQVAAANVAGIGVYGSVVVIETLPSVYLSLNDAVFPNNAYIMIGDIGSTTATALLCNTNRLTLEQNTLNSGGNWYAPNGTRVNMAEVPGFHRNRAPGIVRLIRTSVANSPAEGMYWCVVEDATYSEQTVLVGLYNSGGDVVLSGGVVFGLNSELNAASPRFTLTCISTGGPVTNITWTRGTEIFTGYSSILINPETAQYVHTLTVTGRLEGVYTCTVSNNKPSSDSALIKVQAPFPLSNLSVSQNGLNSVSVSWSRASAATSYIIYYHPFAGQLLSTTAGGSDTELTLSSLNTGVVYSISMIATSPTLPSPETEAHTLIIERANISIHTTSSSPLLIGSSVTLTCTVTLPSNVPGTPTFQWEGPRVIPTPALPIVNGQEISSILSLSEIATSQAGQYTCTATLRGSVTANHYMDIHFTAPTPSIIVMKNESTLYAGTTLILVCDYTLSSLVDTTAHMAVMWFVNNTAVNVSSASAFSDRDTLTISPVDTADTGNYTCELSIVLNQTHIVVPEPVLSHEQYISVQVDDRVKNFQLVTSSDTSLSFSWTPPAITPHHTTGYTLQCTPLLEGVPASQPRLLNSTSTGVTVAGLYPGVTYSCSITSASVYGISYPRILTIATPEIAPTSSADMLEAVAGQRNVTFSWLPPPLLLRNGVIKSYTLSCSPSITSLPHTIPHTELQLTVEAFSPDTYYFCSILANNSQGSGPPTNISFTTLPDYLYFQLRLNGGSDCSDIIISTTDNKLADIANVLLRVLLTSCMDCGITSDIISHQFFTCFPESPSHLTYRARLEGTSTNSSEEIVSLIEMWVSDGPSIIVGGVLMAVDTECSVVISSVNEGECSEQLTSAAGDTFRTLYIVAITGAVVVLFLIGLIILLPFFFKCRHQNISFSNNHEITEMQDRSAVDNVAVITTKRSCQIVIPGDNVEEEYEQVIRRSSLTPSYRPILARSAGDVGGVDEPSSTFEEGTYEN